MLRPFLLLAATLPILACLEQRASALSITTLFNSNNSGSPGGAVYFDVNITNPSGLVFTSVLTNVGETVPGDLQLYATTLGGTSVGNQTNIGAWTLLASGTGTGLGTNQPTLFDITDFALAPGQYGFALVLSGSLGHNYTTGDGSNQFYSNPDLSLTLGSASNVPFTGSAFSPRVWNGTLEYEYQQVPGPLPVLGLGAAFGYSRRLRRRLKRD